MKKIAIKSTAFVALWTLCVSLILWATGCDTADCELHISDNALEYYGETDEQETAASINMPDYGLPGVAYSWKEDTGTLLQSYEDCSSQTQGWKDPDVLKPPCNFRLQDQNGNIVELYDYQGDVIVLDMSTMWCYWCKVAAQTTQAIHDSHESVTVLTVLLEDASGDIVDSADLQAWAQAYNITAPVLAGNMDMRGTNDDQWVSGGIPSFFFIDKDFYVRRHLPGWNEDTIQNYIAELVAE